MSKPKVIFLDWYKTLSNSVFWEQLESKDPVKYEKIANSFLGSFGDLINPWMRGQYSVENMVEKIAHDTRLEKEYVTKGLKISAQNMVFAEDGVVDVIKQLRSNNIKVVVATDNMDTFTRWTVPYLKLEDMFDDILNSWELKSLKGDFEKENSKFFSTYLRVNQLRPSDCVLIDDSEDKEGKIENFGINYIRIYATGEVPNILRKYC